MSPIDVSTLWCLWYYRQYRWPTALFLILELDHPFSGVIQITSTPLRNALAVVRINPGSITAPLRVVFHSDMYVRIELQKILSNGP